MRWAQYGPCVKIDTNFKKVHDTLIVFAILLMNHDIESLEGLFCVRLRFALCRDVSVGVKIGKIYPCSEAITSFSY